MTLSQAPSLKNWTGRDPVLGFEGDIDYFDVLLFKYQSRSHNFKKLFFVPSPEVVQVNDSVITFHYPGTGKALPPYSMNSESKEWSPCKTHLYTVSNQHSIVSNDMLPNSDELSRERIQSKIDAINEEIKFIRAHPKTIIGGSGSKRSSITKSKRWSLPSIVSGDAMSSGGATSSNSNLILEQTVLGGGNSNSNRRSQNEEEFFMDLQQRLNKQYGGMPANLMDNP
ncbi:hypothetical protein FDP41_005008 [Naegleria fowleri]|uniref:Uncharacterized protein n=1 Tax=Naegleria fowleri TaxID=5763 RepID=A0A6A5BN04_NAEFO|nr:uncharacterized protein FDP41_005008 [Naegleria fowleri]KAF0975681.1 hypothetical protein FDP41_005008 [Naegleria fowleri]